MKMNKDKEISAKIGLYLAVLAGMIVLLIILVPIKNLETSEKKCNEIKTLMLDDPEHNRLHNDYPDIMIDLHKYFHKYCNTEDLKMDSGKHE